MSMSIDRAAVQQLIEAGAQLVEVLPEREFHDEHLPGAIQHPAREARSRDRQRADPRRPGRRLRRRPSAR